MTTADGLVLLLAACAAVGCGSSEEVVGSLESNLGSTCQTVQAPLLDFRAEPWQDIVSASVCAGPDGTYTFAMEMAAPIPASPTLPPFARQSVGWIFGLGSTAFNFYYGYPLPPGLKMPADFLLFLTFDGTRFQGTRIDRRALNDTGEATITPLAFKIDGSRISTTVTAAEIAVDGPFHWHCGTVDRMGPTGSQAVVFMDVTEQSIFP